VGAQADQVYANIKSVLVACGGSMDDIVKITVFTTDLSHRPALAEARKKHFRAGQYPASTFLVVSSLADPRFLVEIEAVAMIENPAL
jgi:enamine deaminase RidA (YjgF/YER057c/UK114 family)